MRVDYSQVMRGARITVCVYCAFTLLASELFC